MPRKTFGPGPGTYMLPPVLGYEHHDLSKFRNYQYSMGIKTSMHQKTLGPGPRYDIHNMTRYGRASPAAYSMKSRPNALQLFQTPGPGTYRPELAPRMREPRPPAFSMAHRYPPTVSFQTPGPDKYEVPSTLGPKVPDKHANGAYSMSFRHGLKSLDQSPGPAKYNPNVTNLRKMPNYTMSPRVFPPHSSTRTPGPIYYPKLPRKPGYSFGLRTDTDPYITPDDDMPCINRKETC